MSHLTVRPFFVVDFCFLDYSEITNSPIPNRPYGTYPDSQCNYFNPQKRLPETNPEALNYFKHLIILPPILLQPAQFEVLSIQPGTNLFPFLKDRWRCLKPLLHSPNSRPLYKNGLFQIQHFLRCKALCLQDSDKRKPELLFLPHLPNYSPKYNT